MKSKSSKANAASFKLSAVAGMLFAFLLLLSPLAAHAQSYAGSVRGTVTDPSGAAVAGAMVTLRDTGTSATLETKTTDLGAYSFPTVTVGTYQLTIKATNFKEYVAKSVEVHVSTATEVNARLELGASFLIVRFVLIGTKKSPAHKTSGLYESQDEAVRPLRSTFFWTDSAVR